MKFLKRCKGHYFHKYFYWGVSNDKGHPILRGDGYRCVNGFTWVYRHVCQRCDKVTWKK